MKSSMITVGLVPLIFLLSAMHSICAAATRSRQDLRIELPDIKDLAPIALVQDSSIDPRFTVARFEFADTSIHQVSTYFIFIEVLAEAAVQRFAGRSEPLAFTEGELLVLVFGLNPTGFLPRKYVVWGLLSAVNELAATQRFVKTVFILTYDGVEVGIVEVAPRDEEGAVTRDSTQNSAPLKKLNLTEFPVSDIPVKELPAPEDVNPSDGSDLDVSETNIVFNGRPLNTAEYFVPLATTIGLLAPQDDLARIQHPFRCSPQIIGLTDMTLELDPWSSRPLGPDGPYYLNRGAIKLLRIAATKAVVQGIFQEMTGTSAVTWHVGDALRWVKVGKIALWRGSRGVGVC